jgi:hypothetical protein
MYALVMLNKYLHDFSSGLFFACLVIAWVLRREAKKTGGHDIFLVLYAAMNKVFWLSFSLTLLFGVCRAVAFPYYEWRPGMEGHVQVLIAKHIVFIFLVAATIWYWCGTKKAVRPPNV